MKRLLISLCALALLGAGCFSQGPVAVEPAFDVANTYSNTEFGFAFDYPKEYDVNVRPDDVRPDTYAGLDVDFFASFRDIVRDPKPTNIFRLYALPGETGDGFEAAILASGSDTTEVTAREEVWINDIDMTRLVNTTDIGSDKVHYLFERDGVLIVISVFIGEITAAEPIIETFRTL